MEKHVDLICLFFPDPCQYVVVGANQSCDGISLAERHADWMLALLTTARQSQIGRVVGVAQREAGGSPLLETERSPGVVFLNFPDDSQSRERCQCFCHGAVPSRGAASSNSPPVLFERLPRMHVWPFERVGTGPVSGPAARRQRWFPGSRPQQRRRVM